MALLNKVESKEIDGLQPWYRDLNFVLKVLSPWNYILMGGQTLILIVYVISPILLLLQNPLGFPILLVFYLLTYKRILRPIVKSFRSVRRYASQPKRALNDSRRPILLLRSFMSDSEENPERIDQKTSEEFLVEVLGVHGPVITIGQPGEEGLPLLGATRIYMGQDWQEDVLSLCKAANVIVIDAGNTPSVIWEMKNVRDFVNPRRVMISLLTQQDAPDYSIGVLEPKRGFEQFYRSFTKSFLKAFGVPLPDYDSNTFLIQFDDHWNPYPVKFDLGSAGDRNPKTNLPATTLLQAMKPFFSNLEILNKHVHQQESDKY